MMKNAFSKTQIDRLGDRLKGGSHTESDLRLLDDFRRSFGEAYKAVVRTIRQRGEFPTGRLAKSTHSIVEKLRRESIRLSQMQDIAGCRVVVADIVQQEQFVAAMITDFPGASVIDRRDKPSYGYRAIHIITEISGKPIEVQVRTSLQHQWAELSEKASDVLDPTIKYGGGPDRWRDFLIKSSEGVAAYEAFEKAYYVAVASLEVDHEKVEIARAKLAEHRLPDYKVQEMRGKLDDSAREIERLERDREESQGKLEHQHKVIADLMARAISWLDALKGQKL